MTVALKVVAWHVSGTLALAEPMLQGRSGSQLHLDSTGEP
jgi:hypothetical protein